MLVLSRQRDESILIGDDVTVTVVDIRGDKVRLGIDAPKDVSVHRKEVYDAIQREKKLRGPSPLIQAVEAMLDATDAAKLTAHLEKKAG